IEPLALLDYEARWHIYGIDVEADDERTFLLSRIVGDVTITKKSFDPGLRDGAGDRALRGLEAVADRNSALLEITPGTEASLRLGRRAAAEVQGFRVPFVDVHVFADALASYGPVVRVVEPQILRDAVVARLEAIVAAHADGGES